jgi:DMSO reductase family type II enzyme heme b subunit
MMGNAGGKVHIVHWKAIWQEDCTHGFRDVQDKYPNMWVDVYPGLEAHLDRSKRIYAQDITAEHIVETRSFAHMPGTYSGNPMSQIKRKEPLEEAVAEGFGTLTTQETQAARGWAAWNEGKWRVCVIVPVNTGNQHKASFKDKTKAAFAIWDGGHKNIGGRKHYTPWVDIFLEP